MCQHPPPMLTKKVSTSPLDVDSMLTPANHYQYYVCGFCQHVSTLSTCFCRWLFFFVLLHPTLYTCFLHYIKKSKIVTWKTTSFY